MALGVKSKETAPLNQCGRIVEAWSSCEEREMSDERSVSTRHNVGQHGVCGRKEGAAVKKVHSVAIGDRDCCGMRSDLCANDWWAHDQRDAIQSSPDDGSVIDIHSH